MTTPTDVMVVRLYWKSPGSGHLRKSSAAELATLEAAGWQEKQRTSGSDHIVVRMERPRPARVSLGGAQGGQGGAGGRPRR
jgi:hypothetical protein